MAFTANDEAKLDFAYKYPFSGEAREIVSGMQAGFDAKALAAGRGRVQEAIDKNMSFVRIQISGIRLAHLTSYVYARMVVSALKSAGALNRYAESEAHRSAEALLEGDDTELLRVSDELGLHMKKREGVFSMAFGEYVSGMPRQERFSLAKQLLQSGAVRMSRETAIGFVENSMRKEILKGLPIPAKDLPKDVAEQARTVKLPVVRTSGAGRDPGARYRWIEKLLENPIPDVRHRTVNLILAPYFTNVKGLPEDDAVKAVAEYIDRCRLVNPDTKINDTYIRYQCRYSKERGMRPLSLERAKELIGAYVELQ